MEYLVGVLLALGVSLGATVSGLDRDRAFYTAVALAVGTYYLLFAVLVNPAEALAAEVVAFLVLAAVAVAGFRWNLWLVAAALAGHGAFDLIHPHVIANAGVPEWWPMFCMSYDVTAEQLRDWARMMEIEFVHITKDTTVEGLEQELFLNDLAWKLK